MKTEKEIRKMIKSLDYKIDNLDKPLATILDLRHREELENQLMALWWVLEGGKK